MNERTRESEGNHERDPSEAINSTPESAIPIGTPAASKPDGDRTTPSEPPPLVEFVPKRAGQSVTSGPSAPLGEEAVDQPSDAETRPAESDRTETDDTEAIPPLPPIASESPALEPDLTLAAPSDEGQKVDIVPPGEETSANHAQPSPGMTPLTDIERIELLRDNLKKARSEVTEAKEIALRKAADLENFKRRAQKQIDEMLRYGNEQVLKSLLPLMDDFERGIEHSRVSTVDPSPKNLDTRSFDTFINGMSLIFKKFQQTLERFGVKGFDSLGERFNPHLHEAISQVETNDHSEGTIVAEYLRGYLLHDRLMRPALVVVAHNPTPVDLSVAVESEPHTEERALDTGEHEMTPTSSSEASERLETEETVCMSEETTDIGALSEVPDDGQAASTAEVDESGPSPDGTDEIQNG